MLCKKKNCGSRASVWTKPKEPWQAYSAQCLACGTHTGYGYIRHVMADFSFGHGSKWYVEPPPAPYNSLDQFITYDDEK